MKGILRHHQRLFISGVDGALRAVGPLPRFPSRVERDNAAKRDVTNTGAVQLPGHGFTASPAVEAPEKLRRRAQFRLCHAGLDTDAVDTDVGEFRDQVRVGATFLAERIAVEVHITANDVDLQ